MDNYGTHKVRKVKAWLTRHPRYHVHFTPTSGSWLNLVERLFCGSDTTMCPAWKPHGGASIGKSHARILGPRIEIPNPLSGQRTQI